MGAARWEWVALPFVPLQCRGIGEAGSVAPREASRATPPVTPVGRACVDASATLNLPIRPEAHPTLNFYTQPTDSVLVSNLDDPTAGMPAIHYPPYSEQRLRELLVYIADVSGGDPAATLPSLTEPALYAFTAALVILDSDHHNFWTPALTAALLAELRWRNCRTMGSDPKGQVRLAPVDPDGVGADHPVRNRCFVAFAAQVGRRLPVVWIVAVPSPFAVGPLALFQLRPQRGPSGIRGAGIANSGSSNTVTAGRLRRTCLNLLGRFGPDLVVSRLHGRRRRSRHRHHQSSV